MEAVSCTEAVPHNSATTRVASETPSLRRRGGAQPELEAGSDGTSTARCC